jgi:hypothetical protein
VRALPLVAAIAAASLALAGCTAAAPTCRPSDGSCVRVLFVGNSYTYVNDLPGTFGGLAQSGGHAVETDSLATGGATLADHVADVATVPKLDSQKWSFVVLQEQSEIPSIEASREYTMYPPARTLVDMILQRSETPILFMTWAHRDGLPAAGLPGYESMQQQLDGAYISIAHELKVPVAPVGYTWYMVRHDHPEIELWSDDGSHPSKTGTYLAACVFFASIFRQSPEGLSFHGDVSDEQARALQAEVKTHVLDIDMQLQWGLR